MQASDQRGPLSTRQTPPKCCRGDSAAIRHYVGHLLPRRGIGAVALRCARRRGRPVALRYVVARVGARHADMQKCGRPGRSAQTAGSAAGGAQWVLVILISSVCVQQAECCRVLTGLQFSIGRGRGAAGKSLETAAAPGWPIVWLPWSDNPLGLLPTSIDDFHPACQSMSSFDLVQLASVQVLHPAERTPPNESHKSA